MAWQAPPAGRARGAVQPAHRLLRDVRRAVHHVLDAAGLPLLARGLRALRTGPSSSATRASTPTRSSWRTRRSAPTRSRGRGQEVHARGDQGRSSPGCAASGRSCRTRIEIADDPQVRRQRLPARSSSTTATRTSWWRRRCSSTRSRRCRGKSPDFNEHGDQILTEQLGLDWDTVDRPQGEGRRRLTLLVSAELVEPVTCALLGAIDVDGGADRRAARGAAGDRRPPVGAPRPRPRGARSARPDDSGGRASPTRARAAGSDELMVTLELCRHPETPAQVAARRGVRAASSGYRRARARDRAALDRRRRRARATEDFDRFYAREPPGAVGAGAARRLPPVSTIPTSSSRERLEALHDLPEGTLGHAYIEFYRRNHITVPGADTHTPAHYVSHDMNHVIAGYEPTGPGEIALGAFTLAMNDNDANWIQFIANLAIHEAGLVQHGAIMPKAQHADPAGRDRPARRSALARRAVHRRLQPGRSPHDGRLAARRRARPLRRARAPDATGLVRRPVRVRRLRGAVFCGTTARVRAGYAVRRVSSGSLEMSAWSAKRVPACQPSPSVTEGRKRRVSGNAASAAADRRRPEPRGSGRVRCRFRRRPIDGGVDGLVESLPDPDGKGDQERSPEAGGAAPSVSVELRSRPAQRGGGLHEQRGEQLVDRVELVDEPEHGR